MLRVLRTLTLLLLVFATGRFAYGETINFADLAPDRVIGEALPLGEYDGFVFPFFSRYTNASSAVIVAAEYYPFEPCCYPYFLPYGPNTFAFFYDTTDAVFTLNNLELTSDTTVQIVGLRQGVVVDQMFVATDDLNQTPVLVTLNWSGVDAIGFPGIVGQHYLELEEITVNEAPVPEPTSIALLGSGILGLVAAARSKRFFHSVVHKMCS